MLGALRRFIGKEEGPTWRQWYVIYTKQPGAPQWMRSLGKRVPVRGEVVSPTYARELLDVAHMYDGEALPTSTCHGAVRVHAAYQRDKGIFMEVARLACDLALRETGYLTSLPAHLTYRAELWAEDLGKFELVPHIGVHSVTGTDAGDTRWVHSHGLVQFDLPEVEVCTVPGELDDAAYLFIHMMGQWMLGGERFTDGHTLGAPSDPDTWAICESVKADDNEGHGDPLYPLLRFSDYDQSRCMKEVGLSRYLRVLAKDKDATAFLKDMANGQKDM